MGTTEYTAFIIIGTLIWLVFVAFIVTFVYQYYKRKLKHEKEMVIKDEQHVQDLLLTRLEIQKQTFEDVGREIHDNVGQRLTLASIYANQLAFQAEYPQIHRQLSEISTILNESLSDLRSLSKSLTNPHAEFTDLRELLDEECRRVNDLHICRVERTFTRGNFNISVTIKTFILRIIQEFIQNSLKHAHCTLISLDLDYDTDGLRIHVADNGHGFDTRQQTGGEGKGIGLENMKKRADLIGATFALNSTPRDGTTMNIYIPANKLNAS